MTSARSRYFSNRRCSRRSICRRRSRELLRWRRVIGSLSRRYRVICPDVRGLGWSEGSSSGYTLERLAQDVTRTSFGTVAGCGRRCRHCTSMERTTLSRKVFRTAIASMPRICGSK
ncbi:alpha/beta fold hydrolase [Nocardia jiangxiensis]|uniref:Alpha/beta fold hydrolase n=1 Tax=Nocardia jiangxiensis TaxID=282685 RepID=A0ABW6RYL9_9NOCA